MRSNKKFSKPGQISCLGFGVAIGFSWATVVFSSGLIAMYVLFSPRGMIDIEVIKTVYSFWHLMNLVFPGWAANILWTILSAVWAFTHAFLFGYLVASFYNFTSAIANKYEFKVFGYNIFK